MNPTSTSTPSRVATFADRIVEAILSVVGARDRDVPLHEPCFRGREWEYVKACLDKGWVSSVSDTVTRFERTLSDVTGSAFAVATSSGTAALHTCLMLSGIERYDEVLVPSHSFVATANAVSYTGATPHFVDCEATTMGLDPDKLQDYLRDISDVRSNSCYNRRTGRRLSAIIAVHAFGHPCRIDAIADVAARFRLTLIEDAAESLGSTYNGRHTGRWGRLAALSFNGNKIVTTGGGGAVLTDDDGLARLAKHLTTTAKLSYRSGSWHDRVGYNYRLPAVNAALGCAQLEQLPILLESKRELARRYQRMFEGFAGVRFVSEPVGSRSNYWLCSILLAEDRAGDIRPLLKRAREHGIMIRPTWHLLSGLPMYAECPRSDLAVSESVSPRLVNLPSSPGLLLASTT